MVNTVASVVPLVKSAAGTSVPPGRLAPLLQFGLGNWAARLSTSVCVVRGCTMATRPEVHATDRRNIGSAARRGGLARMSAAVAIAAWSLKRSGAWCMGAEWVANNCVEKEWATGGETTLRHHFTLLGMRALRTFFCLADVLVDGADSVV